MLSYLRKKMKTIMLVVAVLFAATMFYGLGYTGIKGLKNEPKKGSIATVNGKEVDHKRLEQTINSMFSREKESVTPEKAMLYQTLALEQTIDFTIMLNDAKRHFGVSGGELNQVIDQIIQANKLPSKSALQEALKSSGQDYSQFQNTLKEEIIVSKMVNKIKGQVTITPDDLREVNAGHILIIPKAQDEKSDIEARTKAEQILQRVKKGENFESLAIRFSEDPGSAKKGGALGYFTTGAMVPEFEKAAFALKPGEISDVVKTPYGYHIIKVEDTRLRRISEKGKDINEVVLADKQDLAVRKWMYELRQKTKIEVNDPMIKAYSLLLSGKINEAISAYNQASMENPMNPYVHLFLADAYRKAGNPEFALLEYDKAAQNSGGNPGILIAVGEAYIQLKKSSLALEQYRKASLIAGDNIDLHKELLKIFNKIGASADAAKEQSEISRIEKKAKFEKEIQEQLK